ncbi:MAG: hypothetical protein ACJAZO_004405 [Myxococcota bacterium]|jgi:hypothetical protein
MAVDASPIAATKRDNVRSEFPRPGQRQLDASAATLNLGVGGVECTGIQRRRAQPVQTISDIDRPWRAGSRPSRRPQPLRPALPIGAHCAALQGTLTNPLCWPWHTEIGAVHWSVYGTVRHCYRRLRDCPAE